MKNKNCSYNAKGYLAKGRKRKADKYEGVEKNRYKRYLSSRVSDLNAIYFCTDKLSATQVAGTIK